MVHHRGQFTVYLRLLDVPVPGYTAPARTSISRGSVDRTPYVLCPMYYAESSIRHGTGP